MNQIQAHGKLSLRERGLAHVLPPVKKS